MEDVDGGIVKLFWIGIAIFLGVCHVAAAQGNGNGTVCVAARAATPFRGQVVPSKGEVDSGGLRVKIDKRKTVPWPQRNGLKIEGLDLKERHLLAVVNSSGKSVESLWFRFSEYKSTNLCMAYDGYQGIGLQTATRHTPWCKCN